MDPNANLCEQELLLQAYKNRRVTDHTTTARKRYADYLRLSELRQALYDWIRDGGFEPDWSKAPLAAEYYGR